MKKTMYMEKSKRIDLVKYNTPTKIISFRCSQKFKEKGTAARDLLLSVFVRLLKKEEIDSNEIDRCGSILGYKMKKDDER